MYLKDPSSQAERIKKHSEVTDSNSVEIETAAVSVLTFDLEEVTIARLATSSI